MKQENREELCREFYNALINALRYTAYRCGYALAVHGSLKRDIDLIACPWRDSAPDASYLIDMLKTTTEAIIGTARVKEGDNHPEKKPCGRLAWAFYLTHDDDGPYLDISVMPKVTKGEGEMSLKISYLLTTRYACGLITTDKDGIIIDPVAPIYRKLIGKSVALLPIGYDIKELKEPRHDRGPANGKVER